jgi:guanine deaminase
MHDNVSASFLKKAIEAAQVSVANGEFPAGAVVVKDNTIIGEGISIGHLIHDPTSHGELSAIRNACAHIAASNLTGATLYASMEPCTICLSAAMWSGIERIVFACKKEKFSSEYYGGVYKTESINETFHKPLEIIHMSEHENDSLTVVHEWERHLERTT